MPAGGIMNREPKQDFKGVAELAEEQRQQRLQGQERQRQQKDPESKRIEDVASALGGAEESEKNEKDLKQLELYSKEDMRVAEEMLFRGYAEKDYNVLPTTTITITSLSSVEVELVNEMVYEFANKKPKDGEPDPGLSAKVVEGHQQMLLVALGFKGLNGNDISPQAGRSLSFIKAGVRRMSEAEVEGDMKKYAEIRLELKKVVSARSAELKRMPVAIVDTIAKKRYEFERMVYDLTSREDLLPKS